MPKEIKKLAPKVIAVIAWLLATALMLADVLVIREANLDVMTEIQTIRAENAPEGQYHMVKIHFGSLIEQADRMILVAGAVIVAMMSIFVEHSFRVGVEKDHLLVRILRTFGILITILVIGVIVQTVV